MASLFPLIQNKQWTEVAPLLEAHPEAAQEKDPDGYLPLHWAMGYRAPEATTQLLLEVHPEAVREKTSDGLLPLHLALENNAPETTTKLIRQAYAPACILCQEWQLIAEYAHPQWSMQRDAESNKLPLELALEAAAPLVVVQALADTMPQRLETPSHSGASFRTKLLADDRADVRAFATTYGAFLGRYRLKGEHVHRSATCLVIFAEDLERQAMVALKLMHNEGEWLREQCMRRLGTDAEPCLDPQHVVPLLVAQELTEAEAASDPRLQGEDAYRFLLVMPCARRDLSDALAHYRFAGRDWKQVVEILMQVASHLRYLNEDCGRIHGDLKPRNLVQFETDSVDSEGVVTGTALAWCLIDLDASCTMGDQAGQKITSIAYFPPEMARHELSSCAGGTQQPPVVASIGFEMWYFGCLMYQLCTLDGATLWQMNQADNLIEESDLRALAHDWTALSATKLNKIVWPEARHLVEWLLQDDVSHRPQTWADVLQHPFFGPDADAHCRRIVMSCPEHGTLDPDGGAPYDQNVMDKILELQRRGKVKAGFDRAGSSNKDARDDATWPRVFWQEATKDLYEQDEETRKQLIKSTIWFAGYQSAAKAQMKLECQGFSGTLEVICIKGGSITDVEHEEMERIIEGAKHDAKLNQLEINIELSKMSYCAFLQEYDPSSLLPGAERRAPASDLGRQLNHSGQPEPEPETGGSEVVRGDGACEVAALRTESTAEEKTQLRAALTKIQQLEAALADNATALADKDAALQALSARLSSLTEGVPPT